MEPEDENTETTEILRKGNRSWFDRWIDHVVKMATLDEEGLRNECLFFPYSCY